jgi:hypothetical protein
MTTITIVYRMLRMWSIPTLLAMGTYASGAQTVYQVVPDTKGNALVLTIANTSETMGAQEIAVVPVKIPASVTLTTGKQTVASIAAGKEAEVTFHFDIDREAKPNTRDTLEFLVREKTGATSTKSIVVTYSPPATFALDQNYPNPFNPSTTIRYDLPRTAIVSLRVYDVLGREVAVLVNEVKEAGRYNAKFDARNMASGFYVYRLQAGNFNQTRKMLVVK